MNVQEKVMMLKELRKQHNHLVNKVPDKFFTKEDNDRMKLIEEKIEQIVKTI